LNILILELDEKRGQGCKKPFDQLRVCKKKLNKFTLSMDKEWRGFFVKKKGAINCEK